MHPLEQPQRADAHVAEALVQRHQLLSPVQETVGLVAVDDLLQLLPAAGSLTRIGRAHSPVDQPVDVRIRVGGVVVDRIGAPDAGRIGKATTDRTDDPGLDQVMEKARAALPYGKPDPNLPPLEEYPRADPMERFAQNTADLTPEHMIEIVRKGFEACEQAGLKAAGRVSKEDTATVVANSLGTFQYHRETQANYTLTASDGEVSGWAQTAHQDVDKLDDLAVTTRAVQIGTQAKDPDAVEPGAYTVILEPDAVADLFVFLAFRGFNGLACVEGRSPFSDKIDQSVFGENITIRDAVRHELSGGMPFDFEGRSRDELTIVENGVLKAIPHDKISARIAGVESTGHSLPQPNGWGAVPINLVMDPGASTMTEMISSTKKGLLVTRFHYTNLVDPMKLSMTGMTRDGLFLIENGQIAHPVRNMRFTQSLIEALNQVEMVGVVQHRAKSFWSMGSTVTPALKIKDFHFTSKTSF